MTLYLSEQGVKKGKKKKMLRPSFTTFQGPMFNGFLVFLVTVSTNSYKQLKDFQTLSHSHYEQAW